MTTNAPIDFGTIRKNASSSRFVYFELFPVIATFREPGGIYAVDDYVRPGRYTGFAYKATKAGQTAEREPRWPTVLAGSVSDGDVNWTAVAAEGNGVSEASSPSVASVTPSGELLATDPAVVNGKATNSRIRVTLTAGVAGTTYVVKVQFTSGTQTLIGVLRVTVE